MTIAHGCLLKKKAIYCFFTCKCLFLILMKTQEAEKHLAFLQYTQKCWDITCLICLPDSRKILTKKKKKVCKQKHKFTHTAQCTTCADIDSASSKTVLSTISLWLVRLTVRATKMSQCFSPLTLFCSVCKTGSGKRSPSFRPNDPCQCLASSVITQWCYRLLSLKQLQGDRIPLLCSTINVHRGRWTAQS